MTLYEKHLLTIHDKSYFTQEDGILMVDLAAKECSRITIQFAIDMLNESISHRSYGRNVQGKIITNLQNQLSEL